MLTRQTKCYYNVIQLPHTLQKGTHYQKQNHNRHTTARRQKRTHNQKQHHHRRTTTRVPSAHSATELYYDKKWKDKLEDEFTRRGQDASGNKLETYRRFKKSYSTEPYVKFITQKKYRSAYSKFRCRVAPIMLETCDVVEDECHVIMLCTLYTDIRIQLFSKICDISSHFPTLNAGCSILIDYDKTQIL